MCLLLLPLLLLLLPSSAMLLLLLPLLPLLLLVLERHEGFQVRNALLQLPLVLPQQHGRGLPGMNPPLTGTDPRVAPVLTPARREAGDKRQAANIGAVLGGRDALEQTLLAAPRVWYCFLWSDVWM